MKIQESFFNIPKRKLNDQKSKILFLMKLFLKLYRRHFVFLLWVLIFNLDLHNKNKGGNYLLKVVL